MRIGPFQWESDEERKRAFALMRIGIDVAFDTPPFAILYSEKAKEAKGEMVPVSELFFTDEETIDERI